MKEKDPVEQFKKVLDFGYHKGNESSKISVDQLIAEMSTKLKSIVDHDKK